MERLLSLLRNAWRHPDVEEARTVAWQALSRPSSAAALAVATLASALTLRVVLYRELRAQGETDLKALFRYQPLEVYLKQSGRDAPLVWTALAVVAVVSWLAWRAQLSRHWERAGQVACAVAAFLVGLAGSAHLRLMIEMRAPLDLSALSDAGATSTSEIASYAQPLDVFLWLLPVAVFVVMRVLPRGAVIGVLHTLLIAFVVTLPMWGMDVPRRARASAAVHAHPIVLLVEDIVAEQRLDLGDLPPLAATQHDMLALTDPHFVKPATAATTLPTTLPTTTGTPPTNLLLIIMESVGFQYVFDPNARVRHSMPLLERMAQEGLFLTQHRSTANTSPRSIFSLLSGLYDVPAKMIWSIDDDVAVPGLHRMLGPGFDSFFVTPGSLRSFFPQAFVRANGLSELYDMDTLDVPVRAPHVNGGRNERDAMDVMVARMRKAKTPFFATYYSFAAHYPYMDYDLEAGKPATTETILRYHQNLRVLNEQLERLMRVLAETGHMHDTLVVVVSDHGEAFRQHAGNKAHSRMSYEENLRVPAILWAPGIVNPFRETRHTSHIDLAPTILEIFGRHYEPKLMHGESLLHPLQRAALFSYGNEGSIATVDDDNKKLIIDVLRARCSAYDLNADPTEHAPIDCDAFARERESALLWAQLVRDQVPAYNKTCRQGMPFHGLVH